MILFGLFICSTWFLIWKKTFLVSWLILLKMFTKAGGWIQLSYLDLYTFSEKHKNMTCEGNSAWLKSKFTYCIIELSLFLIISTRNVRMLTRPLYMTPSYAFQCALLKHLLLASIKCSLINCDDILGCGSGQKPIFVQMFKMFQIRHSTRQPDTFFIRI